MFDNRLGKRSLYGTCFHRLCGQFGMYAFVGSKYIVGVSHAQCLPGKARHQYTDHQKPFHN
jgi:hypothetical protein